MRYLPAIIIVTCLTLQFQAFAASTGAIIHSPDSADTYADNSMLWHQLRWMPKSQELVATITFSNFHRLSDIEPRHDETFDFRIPGVKFVPSTGMFTVSRRGSSPISIAVVQRRLLLKSIVLSPNTQIQVIRRSGHVAVTLVVKGGVPGTERWVEVPDFFRAPNQRIHGETLTSS